MNMNGCSSALLSSMTASAMAAMANSVSAAINPGTNAGVRRTEVPGFPKGWIREETPRYNYHNGLNNGVSNSKNNYDVVYYTPNGIKVRTKNEMARMLGDNYDLTAFDFQAGKINPNFIRGYGSSTNSSSRTQNNRTHMGGGRAKQSTPTSREQQLQQQQQQQQKDNGAKQGNSSTAVRSDTLVPPIRQTASIFKQPVTVIKNPVTEDPNVKTKPELKSTNSEKPRQLFWEKRLSGMRASYPEEVYEEFTLPNNLKPVGPGIESDVVLASISTSLHMNSGSKIEGQSFSKNVPADKDLAIFLNPEQPLIEATKVSQSDIDKQEARVIETRKKLADAIAALES